MQALPLGGTQGILPSVVVLALQEHHSPSVFCQGFPARDVSVDPVNGRGDGI
jgi:hypothetical protein